MDQRLVAADAALKGGRPAEAIDLVQAVLKDDPAQTLAVYRVLVLQLYRAGRHEEAAAWGARAVERHPKDFELWNLYGVTLRRTRRYPEAVKALDQALKLNPRSTAPLLNKANVYADAGDWTASEAAFSKLVRLEPRQSEHQRGLGRALFRLKRYEPAATRLRQAVAMKKDYVDAWLDLSSLEAERERTDEALDVIERAIAANPGAWRLVEAKAVMLRRAGRSRAAEQFLAPLLEQHPEQPMLHNQFAATICDYDRPRANIHFARAVELAPDNQDYGMALAESLERTRTGDEGANIDAAYEALVRALPLGELNSRHRKIATDVLVRVCDFERLETLGSFRELGRGWASEGTHTALLRHLARVTSFEDRLELVEQHRIWGDRAEAAAARNPIRRPKGPRPTQKIRVGFMSSDLRNHPVAYFALPLFEHVDRERFELFCYSFYEGREDATQAHITALSDAFRWRTEISDRDVAQMIADDQIDILFELGGSTHMNRLQAMAWKPARLSASWLGYPHSAGLSAIDYMVMDPFMTPDDARLLMEKPLMLPHAWYALGARAFRDDPAPSEQTPASRNGHVTFGTANQAYKYGPELLRAWARVLQATPGSRFLFLRPEAGSTAFRRNIEAAFAAEGVGAERIVYRPVRGAHLPVYDEMDISLDTFPQTGGTTTCESLWMGVPVVSLVGPAVFERLSYSVLMNVGLEDLCARSADEYVEIAVALANAPERVAELRRTLRERMRASPLGRTEAFAADFYAAVERTVAENV